MDAILRALGIYIFLFAVFRLSGKRTLGEVTTFDFVLLLIISEATQQAMIGEDFSMTNAWLVITTLAGVDILLALIQSKSKKATKFLEGTSTILMKDGKIFQERLENSRVDMDEILASARETYGIGSLDQINHVILEKDGAISIIPKFPAKSGKA